MVPKALFLTSFWPSCSHMGHMSYVDLPALPPTQGYPRIPKDTKPPSIARPDEKHMIHISRSQKRKTEYHIHKTPITMVYIYVILYIYIYHDISILTMVYILYHSYNPINLSMWLWPPKTLGFVCGRPSWFTTRKWRFSIQKFTAQNGDLY